MRVLRKPLISVACGAMLLSSTASVQANNDDCDLIRALTSKDGKGLRKLSIATTKNGTFDILVSGKKSGLREADACEISGPLTEFELECSWDFEGDGAAAQSRGRALRAIFTPCLAEGWREPGRLFEGTTGSVIQEHRADIEVSKGDDTFEVQMEIEVWRFTNRYNLDVQLSRDW